MDQEGGSLLQEPGRGDQSKDLLEEFGQRNVMGISRMVRAVVGELSRRGGSAFEVYTADRLGGRASRSSGLAVIVSRT